MKMLRVRTVAATTLQKLIPRDRFFASSQIHAVVEATKQAMDLAPKTNLKKWLDTQIAFIWMLHDIALIVPSISVLRSKIIIEEKTKSANMRILFK